MGNTPVFQLDSAPTLNAFTREMLDGLTAFVDDAEANDSAVAVITSVAVDAEDLDAEPLLNHQYNELVSLFPRQANKVELHRVTEILGLGEWLWNVDIRVVANQRFKVPVIALVNLVNLR